MHETITAKKQLREPDELLKFNSLTNLQMYSLCKMHIASIICFTEGHTIVKCRKLMYTLYTNIFLLHIRRQCQPTITVYNKGNTHKHVFILYAMKKLRIKNYQRSQKLHFVKQGCIVPTKEVAAVVSNDAFGKRTPRQCGLLL